MHSGNSEPRDWKLWSRNRWNVKISDGKRWKRAVLLLRSSWRLEKQAACVTHTYTHYSLCPFYGCFLEKLGRNFCFSFYLSSGYLTCALVNSALYDGNEKLDQLLNSCIDLVLFKRNSASELLSCKFFFGGGTFCLIIAVCLLFPAKRLRLKNFGWFGDECINVDF